VTGTIVFFLKNISFFTFYSAGGCLFFLAVCQLFNDSRLREGKVILTLPSKANPGYRLAEARQKVLEVRKTSQHSCSTDRHGRWIEPGRVKEEGPG